jgi:hypothetical protein
MKYRQAKKNLKKDLKYYSDFLDSNPLSSSANYCYKALLKELKKLKDNK